MITFTLCLLTLIAGYFIYGHFIERVFGPDDRKTPALTKADGVDYMPLPTWKIFMIQFLNIAGVGPIFGAIMGAMFERLLTFGLYLVLFLRERYTIIWEVCFLSVMVERVFPKLSDVIWGCPPNK